MALIDERIKAGRQHVWLLELHYPYCSLEFGVGECESIADKKCFNTRASCSSLDSYDEIIKVYKFAEASDDMPMGEGFIPSLKSVSITPCKIPVEGGLGSRSACTVTLADHPHSDIGIDKYRDSRTYEPFDQGTFWGKFRARNPHYKNNRMTVWSGYLDDLNDLDTFDYDNAQRYDYFIETMKSSGGSVTIVAKDPLKAADDNQSMAPFTSSGRADNNITSAVNQTVNITPLSALSEYPASGFVKIGDEVCDYTKVGSGLKLVQRGLRGTAAESHDEGDQVQLCLILNGTIADIAYTLLKDYAKVPANFMDKVAWDLEASTHSPFLYEAFIVKPTGVNELLKALGTEAPHSLFWDERDNQIKLLAVKEAPDDAPLWTDQKTFMSSDVSVLDDESARKSHVIVNFDIINATADNKDPNNYRKTSVKIEAESALGYGVKTQIINAVFIPPLARPASEFAGSRILSRFANLPRRLTCDVHPKDAGVWTGDCVYIEHYKIQNLEGLLARFPYQVVSVGQGKGDLLRYELLQWSKYPDSGLNQPIILEGELANLRTPGQMGEARKTLRDVYDNQRVSLPEDLKIYVRVDSTAVIGSDSPSHASFLSGDWPAGTEIHMIIEAGAKIIGAGGKGGNGGGAVWGGGGPTAGQDGGGGGPAIATSVLMVIENNGVIGSGGGGGGGGGAGDTKTSSGSWIGSGGGGGGNGAGYYLGTGGLGGATANYRDGGSPGADGSTSIDGGNGGDGGFFGVGAQYITGGNGGNGGNLGEDGGNGSAARTISGDGGTLRVGGQGGSTSVAIDGESFITWVTEGDIRGGRVN